MILEPSSLSYTVVDAANLWTMLGVIAALLLAVIAWCQLRDISKTRKADFLFRLKRDFFTKETRQLLFLIENDLLAFHEDTISFFEIKNAGQDTRNRMKEMDINSSTLSTYQIDDLLLGHFEDIYEMFDHYICVCGKNEAITRYINWARTDLDDIDVYEQFLRLFEECMREGRKIRRGKSLAASVSCANASGSRLALPPHAAEPAIMPWWQITPI